VPPRIPERVPDFVGRAQALAGDGAVLRDRLTKGPVTVLGLVATSPPSSVPGGAVSTIAAATAAGEMVPPAPISARKPAAGSGAGVGKTALVIE
jgi:hypothetical protein